MSAKLFEPITITQHDAQSGMTVTVTVLMDHDEALKLAINEQPCGRLGDAMSGSLSLRRAAQVLATFAPSEA